MSFLTKCLGIGFIFLSVQSSAALKPERVFVADAKKTEAYIKDGIFVGGDRAVNSVIVKDIRRAVNANYERLVIDLDGNQNGEPSVIERPPFYHIAVSPDEKRLIISIWGKPKLAFDAKKVISTFKKSKLIGELELFPKMDEEFWTFAMGIAPGKQVEVFELTNPARIILDIKAVASKKTIH